MAESRRIEEIASESLCITIEKILFEESFSPLLEASNPGDRDVILQIIYQNPRVQKVLRSTGDRKPEDVEAVACMTAALDAYLHDLPLCPEPGERAYVGQSVRACRGAGVVALLLAELSDEPRLLSYIGRLHRREQDARSLARTRRRGLVDKKYVASFTGAAFAMAEETVLERLLQAKQRNGELLSDDMESALLEYEAWKRESSSSDYSAPNHEIESQEKLFNLVQLTVEN